MPVSALPGFRHGKSAQATVHFSFILSLFAVISCFPLIFADFP